MSNKIENLNASNKVILSEQIDDARHIVINNLDLVGYLFTNMFNNPIVYSVQFKTTVGIVETLGILDAIPFNLNVKSVIEDLRWSDLVCSFHSKTLTDDNREEILYYISAMVSSRIVDSTYGKYIDSKEYSYTNEAFVARHFLRIRLDTYIEYIKRQGFFESFQEKYDSLIKTFESDLGDEATIGTAINAAKCVIENKNSYDFTVLSDAYELIIVLLVEPFFEYAKHLNKNTTVETVINKINERSYLYE